PGEGRFTGNTEPGTGCAVPGSPSLLRTRPTWNRCPCQRLHPPKTRRPVLPKSHDFGYPNEEVGPTTKRVPGTGVCVHNLQAPGKPCGPQTSEVSETSEVFANRRVCA